MTDVHAGVRVLVPAGLSPRAPALGGRVHAFDGCTMGTTWSVRLVGPRVLAPEPVVRAIQRELDRVVEQMSPWEPQSDISRFNRAAPATWHLLPDAFFEVLSQALGVARDSAGAYDPTAGALVNLWGFGPERRHDGPDFEPPSAEAARAARDQGGWDKLHIDAERRRACQPGGLQIDLSAIAKGYAVDRVVTLLAQRFGFDDVLVEVGGELRGSGLKPDGMPWWVDLESTPRWHDGELRADPHLPPTRVALHGMAVATSGDYRRCFHREGTRYSHTIDPRSGAPIAHGLAMVTVLHGSCMGADALSTALTVLGPVEGPAWAEQRNLAALFVTRRADGHLEERITSAFAALA